MSRVPATGPPSEAENPCYNTPALDLTVPEGCTTLSRDQLIDKIRGALIGNGIGDAIGVITEFSSKEAVIRQYGENFEFTFDNARSRFPKGDWTDDTDQCICLLDMINEHKKVDPKDWGKRLLYWIRHGFPELGDFCGMGLGGTVASAAYNPIFLSNPHRAGYQTWIDRNKNAAANGAVMRTSVLGIPMFHDLEAVQRHAESISQTTHWDSRCVGSCVACCVSIALILQGAPTSTPEEITALANRARDMALEYVEPQYHEDFIRYTTPLNIEALDLDEPRAIGYTLKCIGSGFYALTCGKDFRTVINEITREAGDADTNGAVAGAMLGALVGYSNLPQDWVRGLRHHDWYMAKIDRLLVHMGLLDPKDATPMPAPLV